MVMIMFDLVVLENGFLVINLECFNLMDVIWEGVSLGVLLGRDMFVLFVCVKGLFVGYLDLQIDCIKLLQIIVKFVFNVYKFVFYNDICIELVVLFSLVDVVCIFVIDGGLGVFEDMQVDIFECFCQVDGLLIWCYGGSGLGLLVCKEFVELLGGCVGVFNQLESGVYFWVDLFLEYLFKV